MSWNFGHEPGLTANVRSAAISSRRLLPRGRQLASRGLEHRVWGTVSAPFSEILSQQLTEDCVRWLFRSSPVIHERNAEALGLVGKVVRITDMEEYHI